MALVMSEPQVEPVSLAAARRQCRIDPEDTTWDLELTDCLTSARDWSETRFGIAYAAHTVTLTVTASTDPIELRMPPLRAVESVVATLTDGTTATVSATAYTLDRVPLVPTLTVSTLPSAAETLTITYTVGYLTEHTQTAEVSDDSAPQVVTLEETPVHGVGAVYATVGGVQVALSASAWSLALAKGTGTVTVTVPEGATALEVVYATGTLPQRIGQGLRLLVGLWFKEREGVASNTSSVNPPAELPFAVTSLLGLGRANVGVW